MEEEKKDRDALEKVYENDLTVLDSLKPITITRNDILALRYICLKYAYKKEVDKDNFYEIKGAIASIIREELRYFDEEVKHKTARIGQPKKSQERQTPRTERIPDELRK